MKVLSVFGTRPEAVKMAPVVRLLARTQGITSQVCVTAQHRQMLDPVLQLFQIRPDYDLDLMSDNQSLAELSAAIFSGLDPIISKFMPEWVLVEGDTTTVAITSLLSYYHRVRVGHVEAGLRTHDKWQPFPEEINRRIAGVTADLHFAPTAWARQNLLAEGIDDKIIAVTGNPIIDALHFVTEQPEPGSIGELLSRLGIHGINSEPGKLRDRRLILVTAHRRESFGEPLADICRALKLIASRGDVEIIYPVHLNPNVQETVTRLLKNVEHVTLLPPMDYLSLVHLMKHAVLILTDSGGIQEEAPALGIPVLVLRAVTERPEGIAAGTSQLVGTDARRIVDETNHLLDDQAAYSQMAKAANPFGDGHAAEKIIMALLNYPSSRFSSNTGPSLQVSI